MNTLRYIHLEDSKNDISLIQSILQSNGFNCDPIIVQSESELRANLLDHTVNFVIVDYSLPNFDGLTALNIVKKTKPYLPVIFVSGVVGEETAIETLHQGATDYVLKNNLARLPAAVQKALREANRQKELTLANEELKQNESFLHTITEYSQDAIISLDGNGFIQLYNLGAERIFGWSKHEMLRSTMVRLFSKENRIQLQQQIDYLFKNYNSKEHTNNLIVLTALKKTGEEFPVELSLSYVKGPRTKYIVAIIRDITERVQYEKEIIESRNFYESLIANFPVMVFRRNREGRFVYANKHYCDFLGKSWEEIEQSTVYDHFPIELADKYNNNDALVIESEQPYESVEKSITKNGTEKYIQIIKSSIPDRNGNITGIQGLCWDITEKKRQEKQIRLLSKIVESSSASIIVTDKNSCITYVNQSVINRYHYSREELIGKNPIILKAGKYDEAFYEKLYSHLNAQKPFYAEMLNQTKEGKQIWDYSSYFPVVDDQGEIQQFVAINVDISDRKFFELKLQESEQFAHAILNSLQSEIVIIDQKGKILHANQPWFEFTKINHSKNYIGQNYFEFCRCCLDQDSPTAQQAYKGIKSVIEGSNHSINLQYQYKAPDGEEYWYLMHASKMDSANHYIIEHQNITNEKKLEQQVLHSNKMEAIGQLAGGVAHDFNNIILVIRGFGTLLQNKFSPSDSEWDDLDEILKASDRAENLTRQLLAFSRKQVLKIEILSLCNIIQDLQKMLNRLLGENICITYQLDQNISKIIGDSSQIEQVILNLCINARDAMPDGGEIFIDTKNVYLDEDYCKKNQNMTPGDYIQLQITDTGCGMDKQTQTRIFDPFYTTKEVGKGTGLGLSMAYGIVKQCNGEIFVTSEPGQGTTFKIYFPCVNETELTNKENQKPVSELTQQSFQAKILIVEDDQATRDIVYRYLRSFGHEIFYASNAEDALHILTNKGSEIDLLLTDVVMPGMNGKTLSEKAIELCPNIKIVFMSGYTDNIILEQDHLSKEINFIQKPFNIEVLDNMIQKVLNQNKTTMI